MCDLLTDEERAVKERHGSSWTTRHDMIVSCLYLRLPREFNAELEIRCTATSRPEPEAGHLAHRQVQDHRRGVTSPARWTTTTTRSSGSTGTGLPIIYGTDGSLHPKSRRHLEELHVDVEKLSIRAAFAIAYMAAKANEHLTRMIRRDRAESLVTQSDPLSASF
ncbi:Hypothetical protein GSB_154961 [Giardia duodenalis]|uniref:Reverse transcriptase/endonuclease n=1 Tax=Giardia intestinalis TaxID=5741 RepID=V6TL10_GIAIN|nr:Hypothetical protein GSB_154961 [Giardia intestinalis]